MNNRIKEIRKKLNLTQEAFSSKIDLSRNFIAQVESGAKFPSDRTIKDICRVFNVNEEWLRTGIGEMFRQFPQEDERAALVADLLEDVDDPVYMLIEGIMKTYSRLDPKSKETLKQFSINLLDTLKKEKED